MDPSTLSRELFNLFSPLYLLPLIPLLYLIFKHARTRTQNLRTKPLPPGPFPWPIIGNIHHMGRKPHIALAHFAQVHGPLISLRLGQQLLAVGSSPAAATEILQTHDRVLSARHVPQVTPIKATDLNRVSLVWASGGTDQWKFFRMLCRAELFSTKVLESRAILRETKVNEMLTYLGAEKEGQVVKIGEVVFTTVFNTLANLFFSKDFISFNDEGVASGLKGVIRKMMEIGTTPNLADFYPMFRGLDLQGLNKKAHQCIKQVYGFWEELIKERREKRGLGDLKQCDFLDVMLANGFSDDQINNLLLELFTAGTDTTTSTVEWAMTELLKNKEAMDKVREELKTKINQTTIKDCNLSQLAFLQACIKETLRLHPPVPFLLPHRAHETCEVMNYTIPENSEIFVNTWAIGRDSKYWEDPLTFNPERFIDSNMNFKGQDFEFLPFGAGRRMCPGLPMATKQVELILACLFHSFEWSLPTYEDPALLDMNEKFGITLQKEQPLLLIPKSRKM